MIRNLWWVLFLSLSNSAIGAEFQNKLPFKISDTNPISLSETDVKKVINGLKSIIKDPGSLQTSDVKASKHNSGVSIVCGYMNAKNAFGGYVGAMSFIGVLEDGEFRVSQLGDDSLSKVVVPLNCETARIPLPQSPSF